MDPKLNRFGWILTPFAFHQFHYNLTFKKQVLSQSISQMELELSKRNSELYTPFLHSPPKLLLDRQFMDNPAIIWGHWIHLNLSSFCLLEFKGGRLGVDKYEGNAGRASNSIPGRPKRGSADSSGNRATNGGPGDGNRVNTSAYMEYWMTPHGRQWFDWLELSVKHWRISSSMKISVLQIPSPF